MISFGSGQARADVACGVRSIRCGPVPDAGDQISCDARRRICAIEFWISRPLSTAYFGNKWRCSWRLDPH
jgi:hypothetical protein